MMKLRIAALGRIAAAGCTVCGMDQHYAATNAEAEAGAAVGFCFNCGGDTVAYWKTIWDEVPLDWAELNAERQRLGTAIEAARRRHSRNKQAA